MAPLWIAFSAQNASTTIQSQVVRRKYSQPSRSSASVPGRSFGACSRRGTRTRRSSAAAANQVIASTNNAQPAPTVTTSSAATLGPSTVNPPRTSDISAFAFWSSSRGTSCGIRPPIAGNDSADSVRAPR